MNKPVERSVGKAVDSIQDRLTNYACSLNYNTLSPEAVHAAKVRIIDTLGALIGGFFGEPCRIARNLAAQMPKSEDATIIGTRMKTTTDMAAFVNGTTARYAELTDSYGRSQGHPSDAIIPTLAMGEHMQVNGRDFITGVVLAYEVYQRISDEVHHRDFDNTNFCVVSTAVAAGKLLGLSPSQLSHCISMAVVPNVTLRQARAGNKTMFKAVAAGQAGRAGIFAAMLARAGMEGPHLPFEGKAGWCDHVARERFSLNTMGGNGTLFKILDPMVKTRPAAAVTIPSILAAEKLAPLKDLEGIKQVVVEVYKNAKVYTGTEEQYWDPDSREVADHSIPYLVAVALVDGTVTLRSFNDAHLWNPDLRALMQKVEVVENLEFTNAYNRQPQENCARITVVTSKGERLVGEAKNVQGSLSAQALNAQIEEKFRGLTEDVLSGKQVKTILDRLWNLEDLENVAEIPRALILD